MKLMSDQDLDKLAAWVMSQGPMGPMNADPEGLLRLIEMAKFANKAVSALSDLISSLTVPSTSLAVVLRTKLAEIKLLLEEAKED